MIRVMVMVRVRVTVRVRVMVRVRGMIEVMVMIRVRIIGLRSQAYCSRNDRAHLLDSGKPFE